MSAASSSGHNALHFVGSVPMQSGREVFEALARRFGGFGHGLPALG